MKGNLSQYWRCPESYLRIALAGELTGDKGYFRFGPDTLYGRCVHARPAAEAEDPLLDLLDGVRFEAGTVLLPFDFDEVVDNLRQESYSVKTHMGRQTRGCLLLFASLASRRHPQAHAKGSACGIGRKIRFPQWPVDRTVDDLMAQALTLLLHAGNLSHIPFIWFWPEGASSCAVMTHDIETEAGVELSRPADGYRRGLWHTGFIPGGSRGTLSGPACVSGFVAKPGI